MHFYAKFSFQKKVWEIAWKLEYCISAKLQTSNRHINPQMRLLKKKKKTHKLHHQAESHPLENMIKQLQMFSWLLQLISLNTPVHCVTESNHITVTIKTRRYGIS